MVNSRRNGHLTASEWRGMITERVGGIQEDVTEIKGDLKTICDNQVRLRIKFAKISAIAGAIAGLIMSAIPTLIKLLSSNGG